MKKLLATAAAFALGITAAFAQPGIPGVTKTSIKIGGTFPFSGPASSLGKRERV
jgi:branched-chain amino acid transport system substrate-binding protein